MLKINTKKEEKIKEENKKKSIVPRYITFLILSIILGGIFTALTSYAATIAATNISYSNTTSGLTATNAQDAIDEIQQEGYFMTDLPNENTKLTWLGYSACGKSTASGILIVSKLSVGKKGETIMECGSSSLCANVCAQKIQEAVNEKCNLINMKMGNTATYSRMGGGYYGCSAGGTSSTKVTCNRFTGGSMCNYTSVTDGQAAKIENNECKWFNVFQYSCYNEYPAESILTLSKNGNTYAFQSDVLND